MKKNLTNSFSLEGILAKRGIPLKEDGQERGAIDIIEDMTLRLSPREITNLFYEIVEEDGIQHNLFEEARNAN